MMDSNENIANLLADEKAKSDCLEKEKKSLDEMMLKARSRLEKFDAFILKHPTKLTNSQC